MSFGGKDNTGPRDAVQPGCLNIFVFRITMEMEGENPSDVSFNHRDPCIKSSAVVLLETLKELTALEGWPATLHI